jgi:hypothetical protein
MLVLLFLWLFALSELMSEDPLLSFTRNEHQFYDCIVPHKAGNSIGNPPLLSTIPCPSINHPYPRYSFRERLLKSDLYSSQACSLEFPYSSFTIHHSLFPYSFSVVSKKCTLFVSHSFFSNNETCPRLHPEGVKGKTNH